MFVALTNKKLLLSLKCRLRQNFLFSLEKLTDHWASPVNVVSSNPCVGPKPRIKISFILLSICTDELISTPKIMALWTMLPSGNGNCERESNSIP